MACRQMGFAGAIRVSLGEYSGNRSLPIHLSGVTCTGVENSLESCQHVEEKGDGCTPNGTAGMECAKRGKP